MVGGGFSGAEVGTVGQITSFFQYKSIDEPMPAIEVAKQSALLAAVPASIMLFGSLATVLSPHPPPKILAHALQHLAAGIMLCAISMELVPPLAAAQGRPAITGVVVGFCLGVLVMIGMSIIIDDGEDDSEASQGEGEAEETAGLLAEEDPNAERSSTRMQQINGQAVHSGRRGSSPHREDGQQQRHSMVTGAWNLLALPRGTPPFPWVFAMAVWIDSAMDGLLVGLALVTGKSAGMFMAAAMAVEMGFLGLTFAAACTSQPRHRAVPAVVLGPIMLMLGSAVGGLAANALAANEPALVGCTAFGVAALLYMVCEELLVSAHEEGDDHVWWVDIQVFVGFLMALLIGKLV